jgi:hypothetical protein
MNKKFCNKIESNNLVEECGECPLIQECYSIKSKATNYDKAIIFINNLEKNHLLNKYWELGNQYNNILNKDSENYPYKFFKEVLAKQIAELLDNNK